MMRGFRTWAWSVGLSLSVSTSVFAAFGPPTTYPLVASPGQVAVADYNEDGHLDLAFIMRTYDGYSVDPPAFALAVMLGDGTGHFAPPYTVDVPYAEWAIAAGDLNKDGHLDLVVGSFSGTQILLGDGNGGFTVATPLDPKYQGVLGIAVADVNGDGNPDVLLDVTLSSSGTSEVFLGDGTGGFGFAGDYVIGQDGWVGPVAVADFDGDGVTDWVATGTLGLWQLPYFYSDPVVRSGLISGIAIGDFNGDGLPDVAATQYDSNSLVVALDDGIVLNLSGTFPVAGLRPNAVAAADLDGDGALDLVTANEYSGNLSLLAGNGAGGFGAPTLLTAGLYPQDVRVADFNEDGWPDLVVTNHGDWYNSWANPSLTFYLSVTNTPLGANVSVSPVDPTTGGTPVTLTFDDVTRIGQTTVRTSGTGPALPEEYASGTPLTYYWLASEAHHAGAVEVCVSYAGTSFADESAVKLLQGMNGGSWENTTSSLDAVTHTICGLADSLGPEEAPFVVAQQTSTLPASGLFGASAAYTLTGTANAVALADFDGDGNLDVAVANSTNSAITLFPGTGTGTLGAPTDFPAGAAVYFIVSADFNGDGAPDVAAIANSSVQILLGDGHGHLGSPTSVFTSSAGNGPGLAADFNHDGHVDLAVGNFGGAVVILLGDGSGGFAPPSIVAASSCPDDLTAADFNRDGNIDLAVTDVCSNDVLILAGDGTGAFAQTTTVTSGNGTYGCESADFNRDGNADLAITDTDNTVSILLGNGSAGFSPRRSFPVGGDFVWMIRTADFNGDGQLDVASIDDPTMTIRLGLGNGQLGPRGIYRINDYPNDLRIGDLNNDGRPDIVLAGYPSHVWVFLNVSKNTPTGPETTVTPTDPVTGGVPAEITFADVTSTGYTTIATSPTGPPLPQGYQLGDPPTYYDIHTTATYSGTITVCIHYAGVSYPDESSLRLLHGLASGSWEDITTSLDTVNNTICGVSTSLSPFVVAEQRDTTAPTITINSPTIGAVYLLHGAATASYTCQDSGSGVASCVGTVPNGAAIASGSVGSFVFSVNATDAAGNAGSRSVSYSVLYRFLGFRPPVDAPPTVNVVNAGRTIPVKWQLTDAAGAFISDPGSFVSMESGQVGCGSDPTDTIPDSATTLNPQSLSYDSAGNQFVYQWPTSKSWSGTCRQIWLSLRDGTVQTAKFQFK